MKRYELAKREGMNWQSILIADAESEIKELTRDCVLSGKSLAEVNREVMKLIDETVSALDSEVLKNKVRQSFPQFASKMYVRWVAMAGTYAMGIALIKASKTPLPPKLEQTLRALPKDMPTAIFRHATPNADYPLEYGKQVMKQIDEIASAHATDNDNPHYTLRAGAERQIRWEWQQGQMQDMRDKDVSLVWIDSHANCSERCAPWQGRLYSLDGTTGEIDGVKYEPIENATDIYEYTKAGKAYKNGILSGFNCYDDQTEVLTRSGWKLFKDTTLDDEIYTLNTKTKESEWQYPLRKYERMYNGKMIAFKSTTTDIVVTPNHSMLIHKQHDSKLRFKDAKDINTADYMTAGQEWTGTPRKTITLADKEIDADLYCKFIAYYLADGSKHCDTAIKIAQCNNDGMYEELKQLPFKVWHDDEKIVIHNRKLKDELAIFGKCTEKYIPEVIKSLPREQINTFLNAFLKTDGYIRKPSYTNGHLRRPNKSLFTTSKQMAADLCELALKAGYRPKCDIIRSAGKQVKFANGTYTTNNDTIIIHLNNRTNIVTFDKKEIDYNGFIYCLEVPNHTLLVRRNGRIMWCGNCRHRLVAYRKGFKPLQVPEPVMKHQREIEFRQRELERRVRFYEDRVQASPKGTPIYKHNKELVKKWTEEYKSFSRKNEVPYYPSRLDI